MRILVIYKKTNFRDRRTIKDHLYSFKRYVPECNFIYLNLSNPNKLTNYIINTQFDAVIFHYTFLVGRFDPDWDETYAKLKDGLSSLSGIKAMVPHDEYIYTDAIWQIARDCDVDYIFASCFPHDYDEIYPRDQLPAHTQIKTVFTGYVEDRLAKDLKGKMKPLSCRPIDIGYRALESIYLFGSHGQLKSQVAIEFIQALKAHPEIQSNVKLTYSGGVNTLYGNKWLRFLMSCKTGLGCLGGSSILDIDGAIKSKIEEYINENPNATFEEVRNACYLEEDGRISTYLLGPRHFECAMTKTCQLLLEGDYHGVFYPGVHYIEIKKDFSNIHEVIEKVKDTSYCQKIADQCYKDIVESGRYTYRKFANSVIDNLKGDLIEYSLQDNINYMLVKMITIIKSQYPLHKVIKDILFAYYQRLRVYHPKIYSRVEVIVNFIRGR